MAAWYIVKVLSNKAAADGLFTLALDVSGTPLAQEYQQPGQYLALVLPGHEEGLFAIASAPDPAGRTLELLVKEAPGLANALAKTRPGDSLQAGTIQGQGFPLEKARGKDVLLFATGSGISPVRALLDTLRKDRHAFGRVTLFFGVRTPDAFAFEEEMARWEGEGIRIVRTVSQPGNSGWEGLTGYVQSHVPDERLHGAVAFLCGQEDMVKGVTETLFRQGLPRENVFLNT